MKKINFAFGIHSHQPVGNFDFVFEEAFQKAYQPFLDIIDKFPEFKINMHYTGILWEWIEQNHPQHVSQMKALAERGQVEMMSGGFYEPILSVIPEGDSIGQIDKLTDWVKNHFNQKPRGMWLAERVWEPSLPGIMNRAGMHYSVIDDAHFRYAGLQAEDLLGYYITEDAGKAVKIFPISQKLRYTIPFQRPEVTLEYLKELATEEGDRLIVFADDGEKFGIWPGTHDYVYKNQWLNQFLRLILDNRDWINLLHFSEVLDKLKPLGRIYLPTASYAEMMHWALPVKAFREYEEFERYLKHQEIYEKYRVFVRGGFWRNFLSKYPEVNLMHKKMLYLSERAAALENEDNADLLAEIFNHIWAGQCNCPYWHGVFGGIYLGHIRHAMYQHFLQAEKKLRQLENRVNDSRVIVKDFDCDGLDEVIVETPTLNLYFNLEQGGCLFELDYLPADFNLLNTMTRREEGYHNKLLETSRTHPDNHGHNSGSDEISSIHDLVVVKEQGLENYLIYDRYERKSLIDHFFKEDMTLEKFEKMDFDEEADFVNKPYQLIEQIITPDKTGIILERDGVICKNDQKIPLSLKKTIEISNSCSVIDIEYSLTTSHPEKIPLFFGIEFNFSLFAGDAPDRYYFSDETSIHPNRLNSRGQFRDLHHLGMADE
ncbi:MAG: alpha-amylase/4-alpha-glucanotransferase domain-containing protein, partial [Calditrichia bacterium]